MPDLPIPQNEAHRLQVLFDLNILDTPPEERFDRVTRLAARLFGVPMAMVSLIDADRQWFKSRVGFPYSETTRDVSFCAHAILQDEVMVVEDAAGDPRFAANPLVTGAPGLRFYAGFPLAAPDGSKLGTLCLIDRVQRGFSEDERALLRDLGTIVANEFMACELERIRQRQRDGERWTRAVLEHIHEGVLTLDTRCRILDFNPAAERIFGREAAELAGMDAQALVAEPLLPLRDALVDGNATHEVTGIHPGGAGFPLEVSVSTVCLDGQERLTAVVRDISQRRALEVRNRATDERRRKYFTTATHELRTPMASVLGFSELLLKREFDAATGRELVEIIHRQTERLVALINQLLDLARIEAGGKEQLKLQALAPRELLDQTLDALKGLGQQDRLRLAVAPGLPPISGDPAKLQLALTNIVGNALKYSAPGTPVSIEAAVAGERVEIRVADRGVGMSGEQVAQIYDAFYRAGQMPGVQGSGLGMTIFKEIIDLHGGEVLIVSTPGAGTEVTVRLPTHAPERAGG